MSKDGSNKREFTRVEVSVRSEIKAAGRTISAAPTHSISMKAISVQTPERLPAGTECEIRLILVDGDVEIRALGIVLKDLPDGMVLEFSKLLGLESYEHLRNLVFYNSRDVDAVETEFSTHSGIRRKDQD
jgi:hypothetical protein